MRLFHQARVVRARPLASATMMLAALAASLAVAGCELETRVVRDGWAHFPADPSPHDGQASSDTPTWGVLLARYEGRNSQAEARQLIQRLRREADVNDAWAINAPNATSVYRGQFADPSTNAAHRTLTHTRRIELDGERPFAHARLSSPHHASAGSEGAGGDPMDLAQYPNYYSLQLGFFDDEHDSDRRRAAEQWAADLRDEEHEAFYYHGPTRSMVTIGLFRYEQAFTAVDDPRGQADQSRVDAYSHRVRQLQEEFPHTLANGRPVYLQDDQGRREEQPTVLVRVH